MDRYRAEAKRRHNGRATSWKGKWRKDPARAIAQAQRWRQRTEPLAEVSVVCSNGLRATIDEMERARLSGKLK